jgi:hypothetical protein
MFGACPLQDVARKGTAGKVRFKLLVEVNKDIARSKVFRVKGLKKETNGNEHFAVWYQFALSR